MSFLTPIAFFGVIPSEARDVTLFAGPAVIENVIAGEVKNLSLRPMRYSKAPGKAVLVLVTVFLLLTSAGQTARGTNFDYFLFILSQLQSTSYFLPPRDAWLGKSLGTLFHQESQKPATLSEYTQILQKAISRSPEKEEQILNDALRSLVLAIPDPYAAFLSPHQLLIEESIHHGGRQLGFGILFAQKESAVAVSGTLPGSPADQAGLSAGDVIVAVNGNKIHEVRQVDHLLDPDSSQLIQLEVLHKRQNHFLTLTPGEIRLTPFYQAQVRSAGYLRTDVLVPGLDLKFSNALQNFQQKKARFVLLDFRNCIGGDVSTASRVAGFFLDPDQTVLIQQSRAGKITWRNRTRIHFSIPVYILTSPATASAAELITAVLQDNLRALVIGQPTAGKATIQTTWKLRDGGALRVTTGIYLTPSGRKISGSGIQPNIPHSWAKGESASTLESVVESTQPHVVR